MAPLHKSLSYVFDVNGFLERLKLTYSVHLPILFDNITNKVPQFNNLDDRNKFLYIMTNADDELTNEMAQKIIYGSEKG